MPPSVARFNLFSPIFTASLPLLLSAISGSSCSIGYMLFMSAIELVGLTITFPIVMGNNPTLSPPLSPLLLPPPR